jgi:hypothetical protein
LVIGDSLVQSPITNESPIQNQESQNTGVYMSCPVCFGGEDTLVRESLNTGIGVLMGVTAVVLGCFARFFLTLARRAQQHSIVE